MMPGTVRKVSVGLLALFFLSGCAGSPPKHLIRVKAQEHLSNATELMMQNHPEEALLSVKKAYRLHQISNDFSGSIDDMNRMARIYSFLDQKKIAWSWLDRALVFEEVSDYPVKKVETLILAAELSPLESEALWISEAHRITESIPQNSNERKRLEARLNQMEGLRATEKKDYNKAVLLFENALTIDTDQKNLLGIATDHASLARNYYLAAQHGKALEEFQKALTSDEELRNHAGIAYDLEGISLAEAGLGHFRDAARHMLAAAGIEQGLKRMEMARRDIAFAHSLFDHIQGPGSSTFQEVLSHWFDSE